MPSGASDNEAERPSRPREERASRTRQERAPRPRQERAQATKAAIIRAAATVFASRGYARTTLDGVAGEAGLTKGALYFHFDSKHDLANAVIAEETRIMTVGAEQIMAQGGSALEMVIRLISAFSERIVSDVVVAAGVKLTTEELVAQLDIREPYDVWGDLYTRLFERAKVEGDVMPDLDAAVLSRFLVGLFTGVTIVSSSLTERADLAVRVAEMWQVFLPGIVPVDRLAAVRSLPALSR